MKKLMTLAMLAAATGCADFTEDDGSTTIRSIAGGIQTLGDRVAEIGEAIERDADVAAVPWEDLMETIPNEVDGVRRLETEGNAETDRNGAGLSIAHARFEIDGDSTFVGVADLGALRGGARLALRWVAPLFSRGEISGEIEEIDVAGRPAIRISDDDDGDVLVALLVEGRFAVIAGTKGGRHEDFVWEALDEIDYRQLERWVDYGKR